MTERRSFCHNADGVRKAGFLRKIEAKRVAQRMSARTGDPIHLYLCPTCRCYHVGFDNTGGHAA